MKLLLSTCLLLLLLAVSYSNAYYGPLNVNKTPKEVTANWTDACDECQTVIVKRIVEVATDPQKVAELKVLLSVLCHETSYEAECRLFVSKIDLFLDKLLPFLKNAKHVCQEMHMCGNRRLEQFHRVGLLYARRFLNEVEGKNSLVCEECQFAAHELQTLVDSPQVQQDVQDFLEENVCAHLGNYKDLCDQYLEDVLPDFFAELHQVLADQKKFCQELELCPQQQQLLTGMQMHRRKSLHHHRRQHQRANLRAFFHGFVQRINSANLPLGHGQRQTMLVGIDAVCLECELFVDSVRFALSRNQSVYDLAGQLQRGICQHILPTRMHASCDDFMEMYSPTIVFLTVQHYLDSNTCKRAKLCAADHQKVDVLLSKMRSTKHHHGRKLLAQLRCTSCRALSELLQVELAKPELLDKVIEALNLELCDRLPASWFPICENLVQSFVPLAIQTLLRELQAGKLCYAIHACPEKKADLFTGIQ